MVREGLAWAFARYSYDYVDQEAKATIERLGVHAARLLAGVGVAGPTAPMIANFLALYAPA
jgi:hypothetical protein